MADDYNNEEEIVEIIGDVLKDTSTGINARLPTVKARYSDYIDLPAILDKNFFNTEDDSEWQEFPTINYHTTGEDRPDEGNNFLSVPVSVEIMLTVNDEHGSIKIMSKKLRRYSAALFTCLRDAFHHDTTRLRNVSTAFTDGKVCAVNFTGGDKRYIRDTESGAFLLQKVITLELRQIRG